jgi:hypothetical protein
MIRNFKKSREKGEKDYLPLEQMVIQRVSRVSNLEDAQKEWEVIFNAIEEGLSIHDTNFNIL